MTTIKELSVENFMKIELVELSLSADGLTVLGGDNEQGKSSVLRALKVLLQGAEQVPSLPVRIGQEEAVITATLSNGDTARAVIKPDGTARVTVKDKDGRPYASPAKMLKALVSAVAFDPEEFRRQKPAEKAELVRKLLGLDWDKLDADRKGLYDERTNVNRQAKAMESQLAAMPIQEAPPTEVQPEQVTPKVIDLSPIAEELEAANRVLEAKHDADHAVQMLQAEDLGYRQAIEDTNREIARLNAVLTNKREAVAKVGASLMLALAKANSMVVVDTEPIRQRMQDAESSNRQAVIYAGAANRAAIDKANETNAKVRRNAARKELSDNLKSLQAESENYSGQIEAIDRKKAEDMAAAKFPVAGLAFAEDGLRLNGVPLDGCSTEESIRLSLAIGAASNPTLKTILIDDGGAFDRKNLELVAKLAHEQGLQILMTRASDGPEVSFVIEAGKVKA